MTAELQRPRERFDTSAAFRFLIGITDQANDLARKRFGGVNGVIKEADPNQILTQLDGEIGSLMIGSIRRQYPDHGIIDEEAGTIQLEGSRFVWTIDPVDGTAFLASGDHKWGTMIGLLCDGVPIGGSFSLPVINGGMTCLSMEGEGVWIRTGKTCQQVTKLQSETNLNNVLIDFGVDTHYTDINGIVLPDAEKNNRLALLQARFREKVRKLEAGGSPYGWVSMMQQSYGGSLCVKSSKIWDRVPVHHAIVALGGVVTEFDGSPIDYKGAIEKPEVLMGRKFGVCAAANGSLHSQLQSIIHANSELWQSL